jgi:hypothetical protein
MLLPTSVQALAATTAAQIVLIHDMAESAAASESSTEEGDARCCSSWPRPAGVATDVQPAAVVAVVVGLCAGIRARRCASTACCSACKYMYAREELQR